MTSLLTNEPRTPRGNLRLVDPPPDADNNSERWDEPLLSRTDRWMLSLGILVACALIAVVERVPKFWPWSFRSSTRQRNPDSYQWGVCGSPVVTHRQPHSDLHYDEW